jgi:class 3 adenylate cyclase/predicted ATPase
MRCSKCATENPGGKKFCGDCGASLANPCAECGAENPPGKQFCGDCGASLSGDAQTPPARSRPPARVNQEIRVRSDATDSSLVTDGERKTITVLSADIKGSMDLIEDVDPEEAGEIFDPAIKVMIDAVHRFDGYVAHSTGDGIFALFGAPAAHEDHPQRALYAALRMQEDLRRYTAKLTSEGKPALQVRVGANTGEVVVRTIRTGDEHTEYTPIGHSASVASRMQALAPIGSIAIAGGMRKLVEGYFALKPLGPAKVKGVTEPVDVYEVVGLGPLRTKLQRSAGRGFSRFVGRQYEMEALASAAELAKRAHGQIVAAVAEPGAGKSRLFYEFKLSNQSGWTVMEAFSVSHGKANPYAPVIDLLHTYFGIEMTDEPQRRRERVSARILILDPALEDTIPYLHTLLGIIEGDDSLAQIDGPTRRRRTLDAIKRVMLRESLNQPLMVIFEDLHWIDGETQALLDLLAASVSGARILLLVNYRPEYRHEWSGKTSYTQLRLEPLGRESISEMLTGLVGNTAEVQPLRRLIMETTGGNPFFMEETIQALFEEGVLVHNGEVKIARPLNSLRIPPTVQGMLASRIDRLSVDEKQLLQTLAIIGRRFGLPLVEKVAAQPEETLHSMLAELEKHEFIFEEVSADEIEYSFQHALTQEVTLNSMLSERRKSLHERTAQAIESLYAGRLDDHVNELAHHYQHAANIKKAVEFLTLAGQQASKRAAYVEAVGRLSLALELLTKMPETPERDQHELALQSALGPALMETKGDSAPETKAAYSRIAELSQRVGQPEQAFWAQGGLFLHHMVGGRFRTALAIATQLLQVAQATGDRDKLVTAHGFMGAILFLTGQLVLAHSHFEQFASHIDPPSQRHIAEIFGLDVATGGSGYAEWPLWMLGYPDQSLQRTRRTLSLAEERGHLSSTVMALHHAALGHLLRREAQTAKKLAEKGLALAIEHGFDLWKGLITIQLGTALVQSAEDEKGIVLLEEGRKAAEGAGWFGLNGVGELTHAYGKIGHAAEGLKLIAEALAAAHERGEAAFETDLHRVKGELLLMQDAANAAEAEHSFRTAIEHARQRSAKSWELRATTSLARLLVREGRRDEARSMLADIYNWFTEGFDTVDLRDAKALLEELSS